MIQGLQDLVRTYKPPKKASSFEKNGQITPEEFVQAGNFLVSAFPIWKWETGEQGKNLSYLPSDKQYLHLVAVPCHSRANLIESPDSPALIQESTDFDDLWIVDSPKDSPIFSIDEDHDDGVNPHALPENSTPVMQRQRIYDVSITYDNYYMSGRVWLRGRDASTSQPLTFSEICMDISSDHAMKTVTEDVHPHLREHWVSIHPCKHASVLHTLFTQAQEDASQQARVEHYFIYLLKLMSVIVPTMEIDCTIDALA
ncbi:putative autophagy protein 3 [Blattamonas nauphoetae]|uniref:Autophagy protein 3 n=1 Tax=Blattamonas nauphoetae TaxID=2049346 RepID=A0ABQ9Y6C5_9EUKA|nr:putative autophagy protein 3 [Blattamonas nauphoetae]